MSHRIARFLEPLLRLLLPGTGRRRRSGPERPAPPSAPLCPACHARLARLGPLRGEDHAMVRPYLVAHERRAAETQREEERRQRAGRRALWLAVRGVDIGPRVIHGVEVTA